MSTYTTRSFTHPTFLTKHRAKEILMTSLFLLFVSPLVYHFEVWTVEKFDTLHLKHYFPEKQPSREVNQYAARLSSVNLQLLRNPQIRMVRVEVPLSLDSMGSMLAISRKAKPFLEANKVSFVDPVALSPRQRTQVKTPFDVATLTNYILIEDLRVSK